MSETAAHALLGADELLTIDEVCAFFGGRGRPLHPCTIYRGVGSIYPEPVKVGGNSNRWLRSECAEKLAALIAARRKAA